MGKTQKTTTDFEIEFYEKILKRKPDFVQVLIALGDLYTQKGYYEKGLLLDQQLSVLRPEDPVVHYNLACSYSLLKQIDIAFESIKTAVRFGYADIGFMDQDTDLDNLRKDRRFQVFLSRLKNKTDKKPRKRSA